MESSHDTATAESRSSEWQELRGHARHQTVEVLRLILILLQDAVILVAGFLAEFAYEHWLHSEHPFFQLALNLSSAFFLLLYVITVSVHVVQYVRGQIGGVKATLLGQYLPWAIVGGGVLASAVALTMPSFHREGAAAAPQQVMRATIQLGSGERIPDNGTVPLAISPDGSRLVYSAQKGSQYPQLYVRSMDSLEDRAIPETETGTEPFFSPDGQWIGFFLTNGVGLKKVPVNGGPVTTVIGTGIAMFGAAWSADDRIILPLTINSALSVVSAAGGMPQALTKLEIGEISHRWPEALPGGKAVLFVGSRSTNAFDDAQIMALRLGTGERKVLVQGGTFPHYVPTGHLLYYRAGNIMAVPFDPERLEVKGSPVAVMEGVRSIGRGDALFAVSKNGTLVYSPGSDAGVARSTLVWVDRKGISTPLHLPPHAFIGTGGPKLSPDGKSVAVLIAEPMADAWVYDLVRDTLTRLSFDGTPSNIAWSPDGKRVVYNSVTKSGRTIFWKPADGSGAEEPLVKSDLNLFTGSFTPDGRTYIYSQVSPKTGRDIFYASVDGDRKPHAFLQTPFNETAARFSPDGRYVAYLSDESGRNEIYVQPFPGGGAKYQISTEGGREMVWGADGEIYYRNGDKMMAVPVKTQPTFEIGKPQLLFEAPYVQGINGALYDVSRDGQRFLMLKPVASEASAATQITVVQNWFEELKQKVPVK